MNASTIITEDMTLDEKLAAIDAAMGGNQKEIFVPKNSFIWDGKTLTPVDPAELLICDGCQ